MNKKKCGGNSKIFSTIILVFVVCCLMSTSLWAARKVEFYHANAGSFIEKLNQDESTESESIGPLLGLSQDEAFTLLRQGTDLNGITHYRYQQTYKGIPVWGIQTVISRDPSNKAIRLHGAMVLDVPGDVKSIPPVSSLDPLGALNKMEDQHKKIDKNAQWTFRNEEYGIYIYLDKKEKAHLCCVVSFFADTDCGNPSRPVFFIDAKSGKIIDSFDSLAYAYDGTGPGGNEKIGEYTYGTDYPKFGVAINGSTCTMNYADCKTVDLNHGTSGTTPFSYTCYNNTHEAINGGYCPLNDAQFFGQQIYNMYMDWYGVPVLSFQLMMRCHYSNNYENAFWDGSSMTFGDGYTTFYPLVALDVTAHEVSHGFTENNSGLIYSLQTPTQSGGINDAFSDMAGEAAKYYVRGANDFKVGYDIFKSPTSALRYMYDPPLDGVSIDHVSEYYEGLEVHYSSGIFNKAFYLIATTAGWNTKMAFDIFVKANTDYWVPSSTFVQGAEGAMDAAVDLGYSCTAVRDAFAAVGINLVCACSPVANFSGTPTSSCAPLTVNFTDQSTNNPTSWSWNFGDFGTSAEQDPSHTYTTPGTYTVSLTVTNACDSDTETKVNYITVLPPPPVADFSVSSTNPLVCESVTFTDQSANNPTSWSWTFEGGNPGVSTLQNPTEIEYATPGTYDVTLTVTNACGSDTETKVDYITVACQSPVAGFSASDTTPFVGETVTFTDQSTNCPTFWAWDFGDNDTATGPGPHQKVYDMHGTYTVTLFVVNTCGSDSEIKTGYITVHPGPEEVVANFEIPETNRNIYVGDSVMFTDQSTGGPTSWTWTFDGGTPDTSTLQNPVVKYNTAGTFDVTLVATDDQGSDTKTIVDYITVTDTYCDSSGSSQAYEWIAGVHVGGLLNNTSVASSYSNFTEKIACLQKNETVSVSLKPGFARPELPMIEYWTIWIDYNHDGDFSDPGEEVFSGISPAEPGACLTGDFFNPVPTSAINGYTRMRVSMKYGDYPQSCETFDFGEVENYTVYIFDETEPVGNTTIFERTIDSSNRCAMPFTMPESGKIISITMYHESGSGNMILGVYDGEDSPQNRLGVTTVKPVEDSDVWQTIDLESPAYVAGGNTVWLAWVYENNTVIAYDSPPDTISNPLGRYKAEEGWSGGMPETFGIGTQADHWYSIYATYIPSAACNQKYTLTTNVQGNGTVPLCPPGGTYCEGTVVPLTAVPDAGWQFDGWSGDLSGSTNPTTITMDANKNVTAAFSQIQYTLTVNTVGQGSVVLNPPGGVYNPEEPVTLTANRNLCWQFDGWSGDLSGTENPATITMDADKTVTANFSAIVGCTEISEAVDYPSLIFTLSGDANWFSQTTTTYYGDDAAQSGDIGNSQTTTMETTVSGITSVKFYWKVSSEADYDFLRFYIDGVEKAQISGEVDWTPVAYDISVGTHTLKWSYTKDEYVSSGSDCGLVDKLELAAPEGDPIAEAVDYPSLTFTLSGNGNWYSQTTTTYYDGDAAQSPDISDNQTTTMETTISGKTSVEFYWKVSSEADYDYLKFYIDGVEQDKISGLINWTQKSYTVTSDTHTLKWSYTKDEYDSSGSDCGWVDLLELQ